MNRGDLCVGVRRFLTHDGLRRAPEGQRIRAYRTRAELSTLRIEVDDEAEPLGPTAAGSCQPGTRSEAAQVVKHHLSKSIPGDEPRLTPLDKDLRFCLSGVRSISTHYRGQINVVRCVHRIEGVYRPEVIESNRPGRACIPAQADRLLDEFGVAADS